MSIVPLLPLAMAAVLGIGAGPARMPVQPDHLVMVQADAGGSATQLEGSEWLLTSLRDSEVDPTMGSSLEFDEEGNAFGNGGCNRFRGAAEIDGSKLTFGDLASTMMACEEANMKQEAAFHAAMAETATFAFEEGDLLLLDGNNETVARLSPAK